jgi:small subunit ribosomal protein S8
MFNTFAARFKRACFFSEKLEKNDGPNSRLFNKVLEVPASNLKKEITKVLFDKGYILNYKFEDGKNVQGVIKIALKYNPETKENAITHLERVSTPGLRQYANVDAMPRVLNGLGVAIVSTSKGVMTDKEARKQNVGGEVLCYVY